MSTTLPTHCGRSGCEAEIGSYAHVCSSQHLQYKMAKMPLIVLLVSALVGIHLFHVTGDIWPVYFLASLGFLHVYAIAFSRGRALGRSSLFIAVGVASWLIWELLGWSTFRQFGIAQPLDAVRQWVQVHPVPVVLALLFLSTMWMLVLGHSTALNGLHVNARLNLSVGAFILSTWGAWGLLIQAGVTPNWLIQAILLATVFAPLVVILAHSGIVTNLDSKLLAVTFWMTLLSGYIAVTKPLVAMVRFFLVDLLPRLVGRSPLIALEEFWLLKFTDVLAQISLGLQIVAMFSLVAASITTTVESFRGKVPSWFAAWKQRRSSSPATGVAAILLAPAEMAMVLATFMTNLALFIVEVVKNIALNILTMFREIPRFILHLFQFLVVPVATFGAIGFGFLIVLQDLGAYVQHFGSESGENSNSANTLLLVIREAPTLWGEAVTVVLIALLASSLTFALGNRRFWNEGQAAMCVLALGYLATTAIGAALTFLLQSVPNRVALPNQLEGFGDLVRVNLVLVAMLVVAIVIASIAAAFVGNDRFGGTSSGAINLTVFIAVLPLLAFCGYALSLGLGPLFSTARNVVGG